MTIQTQRLHPLLNWVNFLFYKLSAITSDLVLQNEPKLKITTLKKRNEPKLSSWTENVLTRIGKPEPRKCKTNPFGTNEPNFQIELFTITSDMEIAYDIKQSTQDPKKRSQFVPIFDKICAIGEILCPKYCGFVFV